MPYQADKLNSFEEAILKETKEQIASMEEEIKQYEASEMEKAREEEYNEMFLYMQEQVRNIKARHKQAITKFQLDSKRSLLQLRNQLANQVFSSAAEKLRQFADSQEYTPYLIKKIQQAAAQFPSENCEILVREQDLCLEDELKRALPFAFSIRSDPKNHLGGFTLINREKAVLSDYTFASLLEEEHKTFYETCGMKIEF